MIAEKPAPVQSLGDALSNQSSYGRPQNTFVGVNTGTQTLTFNLTLSEVVELTEIANEQSKNTAFISQRRLDVDHAKDIAVYMIKGLLSASLRKKQRLDQSITVRFEEIRKQFGIQPYLSIPPIVASLRNCSFGGTNLNVKALKTESGETIAFKIFLNPGDTLWVVDGQHRRKGIQYVKEFLDHVQTYHKYPMKGPLAIYKYATKEDLGPEELQVWADCLEQLRTCTVAVEVHLGLDENQERQLFHDLNNYGKKVDKSLALRFDASNPVNNFIVSDLIDGIFEVAGFEIVDKSDWSFSGLTRQELIAINAQLFLNKTNVAGAVPPMVEPKRDIALDFWKRVLQIPFIADESSKQLTVAAQPVVLKALSKLFFDFFFGKKKWATPENAQLLLDGFTEIDYSHENPMWRYYQLTEEERTEANLDSLREYLPSDDEGYNRDIGQYDPAAKTFRFGAKHNDIYPILGDMIRWKLGLPSRKKEDL